MVDDLDDGQLYNPIQQTRTWQEWAEDSKIRRLRGFLHNSILVRTEVSMIYGPGGSGKSYLAKYIGLCVAMGLPVHNMTTMKGRVLFLSEEMPVEVIHARCRRMLSVESYTQLEDRFMIRCQSEFDFSRSLLSSQKRLEKIIKEARAELVFMDCLADIHKGEENSNTEMGVVLKGIRSVARVTGAAVPVVHHMGKPGEDGKTRGARGATIMGDKCETLIEVTPVGKYGEPRSLITFRKTRHVVGMKPPAFEFVQDQDPGRMINIADPDETPLMEPAIIFSTSDHKDFSANDMEIRRVRDVVVQLAPEYPDGLIPTSIIVARIMSDQSTSEKRATNSIKRAKALGVVVAVSGGRKLGISGS